MIDQRLANICRILDSKNTFIQMILKLEKSIEELKLCNDNTNVNPIFIENEKVITVKKALIKLEEDKDYLKNSPLVEVISQSITRLKEFDHPIPSDIIVRWDDINKKFTYVKQTSLGLSIGTSIFELEYFPAGSDNSIIAFDSTSIYLENTSTHIYGIDIYQTNGTINLDTCSPYSLIYVDGSEIIFQKTSFEKVNYQIVNVSRTTQLVMEGDLNGIWDRDNTGYLVYEIAGSPNTELGNDYFMIGF